MTNIRAQDTNVDIDLKSLFWAVQRKWVAILCAVGLVGILSFIVVNLLSETYRSEARILIDSRDPVFDNQQQIANSAAANVLDEPGVTSQVEILKSNDLVKTVALELDLASYAEFNAPKSPSFAAEILIGLGLISNPYTIPAEERVLNEFYKKLSVYQVQDSRVIAIEFSSKNPQLAAKVPNAMADIFLRVQSGEKLKDNSNASAWLEPEIARLQQSVGEAEARVAAYRAEKGLLLVGQTDTINTQQLADISAELTRVRSENVDVEARAQTVRRVLEQGQDIESIANVLDSATVQRLRENEADIRAQIADLSTTLLDAHPRMQALRSQLIDVQGQLRSEARKVLASLENEAVVARLREQELQASLNNLKASSALAGEEEVELRALERDAASQRELLETYLLQFRQAASRTQASAVSPNARIISTAIEPTQASFPRKIPIITASMFSTFLLSVIWIMLAELFSGRALKSPSLHPSHPSDQHAMPSMPSAKDPVPPSIKDAGQDDINVRTDHAFEKPALGLCVREMAQEFQRARPSILFSLSPKGDTASLGTLALARQMARDGGNIVLLDLTLEGSPTHGALGTVRISGLTNLLCGETSIAHAIHKDHHSGVHVFARGNGNLQRAMAAFERVPLIIDALTESYDTVFVECGATDASNVLHLARHLKAEFLVSSAGLDNDDLTAIEAVFTQAGVLDILVLDAASDINNGDIDHGDIDQSDVDDRDIENGDSIGNEKSA